MDKAFLVWNCQEAASSGFIKTLKNYISQVKPSLIALLKLRVSRVKADKLVRRTGFDRSFHIEATGFSGGIWMMWKEELCVEVHEIYRQYIQAHVKGDNIDMEFTVVYASLVPSYRQWL